MPDHSPTPWLADPVGPPCILDAEGYCVAYDNEYEKGEARQRADYDHIVACVNAAPDLHKIEMHDELVAALTAMHSHFLALVEAMEETDKPCREIDLANERFLLGKTHALLAKAKAGP